MALRQFAVFMNAGSYVISPKSSASVWICRRSIARIVPSSIGSSYFFPVRLSVIVSVSFIGILFGLVGVGDRLCGDLVRAIGPARKVRKLTTFAAERPPRGIHRVLPAEHAQRLRRRHAPI